MVRVACVCMASMDHLSSTQHTTQVVCLNSPLHHCVELGVMCIDGEGGVCLYGQHGSSQQYSAHYTSGMSQLASPSLCGVRSDVY